MSVIESDLESSQKKSLSTQSTTNESCKKDVHSCDFAIRKKPIRKAKFLSRKEAMFRYMEQVEAINKKLTVQKIKIAHIHKKK